MSEAQVPNENLQAQKTKSAVVSLASVIAGHDADLVGQENRGERTQVAFQAVTLLWAFAFAAMLWWAYLRLLTTPEVAVGIALFIACGIYLLDRSIVASDWHPTGVLKLKNWHKDLARWGGLTTRIVLAFILSYATATGAITYLYRDQIVQWLEHDRSERNKPLIVEYDKKIAEEKAAVKSNQLETLQADLKALNAEREAMLKQTSSAAAAAESFQERASAMRIEADRQLHGGKIGDRQYKAGAGVMYGEAARQEKEANRAVQRANDSAKASQSRIAEVDARIDAKQKEIASTQERTVAREKELLAQRDKDPRWVIAATGPLALQRGLNGLSKDPVDGEVVSFNAWLLKAVIVLLELIPVLTKTLFAPASILVVRYTKRVREEAARLSAEFARNRDGIDEQRQRPDLHVVGGQRIDPADAPRMNQA